MEFLFLHLITFSKCIHLALDAFNNRLAVINWVDSFLALMVLERSELMLYLDIKLNVIIGALPTVDEVVGSGFCAVLD